MRFRSAAIAALAVIFTAAWFSYTSATPERIEGVLPTSSPTPYVQFLPDSSPVATAVVVHGLSSNKEFMQSLTMAFADAGFNAYAIDLPGHGDSQATFTYANSLRALEEVIDQVSPDSIVVGHSLGGALLADLAAWRRFQRMILISPAPTTVETLQTDQLLVVTGGLDAPRINEFAPAFLEATEADGEWWNFAGATHSTTVFDPSKLRMIIEWAGGRTDSLRIVERFAWLVVMVVTGVMVPFMFLGQRRKLLSGSSAAVDLAHDLRWRTAAFAATLMVLWFVSPFEWLDLFATDYLLGFLFISGLLLWRGRGLSMSLSGTAIAVIGAVYVVGVFGVIIGSQLMHLVPSGAQWFRVPIIAAAGFPLFLYDERTLRPIQRHWKRWAAVLWSRILLAAAVVTGVLLMSTGSSFLVLIIQFFVVFWIFLWAITGIVRRVTGEPGAAALFAALVQGWAFAATFVRI